MKYDIIIVGAGIVGLASALKIKENSPEKRVLVLEKEGKVAQHQTGNNSGVIHSGIYYRPGSLKAQNCLSGYREMINFCDENYIGYERCGKLIVATAKEELGRMEDLYRRARENGLTEIKKLQGAELKEYEPHVKGIAGMYLPYTGITDYKLVAFKMQEIFEKKFGGKVMLKEEVKSIKKNNNEIRVTTENNEHTAKIMVNTAGLFSDRVAELSGMHPGVRIIPFRGEYYTLVKEKEYLVKNLIYPIPDPKFPFLGVHFTRLISGGIEAGPNAVFAFKREAYRKNSFSLKDSWESLTWPGFQKLMIRYAGMGLGEFYRSYNKAAFTKALQNMLPEIRQADLVRGITGVRAQACDKKGNLIDDFLFAEEERIINVLNSPSPAATASLSIGRTIAGKALEKLK